eukprot:TRINITY_DN6476_c0_g1_i1.p1 TRINITY_DN6476_c0_g1~~TRINITY_DN6476_c0_g1_i1.p1  ORF type:complete len:1102 (-),score=264.92 TRINITY_DN6476_c0_g1_i1:14-3127(-)
MKYNEKGRNTLRNLERGEIFKFKTFGIIPIAYINDSDNCTWAYYDEKEGLFRKLSEKSQKEVKEFVSKKSKGTLKLSVEQITVDPLKNTYSIMSELKKRPFVRIYDQPLWCYFSLKKWVFFGVSDSEFIEIAFQGQRNQIQINGKKISFKEMFVLITKEKVIRIPPKQELFLGKSPVFKVYDPTDQNVTLESLTEEEIDKIRKSEKRRYIAHVKEMLWTSPRNFKMIDTSESIKKQEEHTSFDPSSRVNFDVEGNTVFTIDNLLSEEECNYYIQQTNKVGYEDLSMQFEKEYRGSHTILVIDEDLSTGVWKRLQKCFTEEDLLLIKPVGFGNEGTWKVRGLNQCFKFSKYEEGACFQGHIDGPWVPAKDVSSIFTVVIYLNDDFEGGETNFYEEPLGSKLQGKRGVVKKENALAKIVPKRGRALLFNHDTFHEGDTVLKGTKYIIRTEVLFYRVDTPIFVDNNLSQNPEYKQMVTLYKQSWKYEAVGKVKEFTDTYLEALKLQRAAKTGPLATKFISNLPSMIWRHIITFLGMTEVCTMMTICKFFYALGRDSRIWKNLFFNSKIKDTMKLPFNIAQNDLRTCANLEDWYAINKFFHFYLKHSNPIYSVGIDIGRYNIKSAFRKKPELNFKCFNCGHWGTAFNCYELEESFCKNCCVCATCNKTFLKKYSPVEEEKNPFTYVYGDAISFYCSEHPQKNSIPLIYPSLEKSHIETNMIENISSYSQSPYYSHYREEGMQENDHLGLQSVSSSFENSCFKAFVPISGNRTILSSKHFSLIVSQLFACYGKIHPFIFVEPYNGFFEKVYRQDLTHALKNNQAAVCYTIINHGVACLASIQKTTGLVIDLNSKYINISAIINEECVYLLPFDTVRHKVLTPDFLNHLTVDKYTFEESRNFFNDLVAQLPSSKLPIIVATNISLVLSKLTTQQQQSVSGSIVITGSFVGTELVVSIEKEFEKLIDQKYFSFNFVKNSLNTEKITVPFDHMFASCIGAVSWYDRKIEECKRKEDLNEFLKSHVWLIDPFKIDKNNFLAHFKSK